MRYPPLTGFAGGLLGLYLTTPGLRKEGSLAPTEQGLPVAKDVWLLGIGVGLLTRGTVDRGGRRVTEAAETLAKADAPVARAERRAERRTARTAA
ncbi:hypothetical protein [Geodermatophilus sp. URMC 62]|uniref:hypothetical protein n=1 Tax=Geodermatophilus sp. URMC 62 TaxID=3423414 RepID=UPI00406C5106